MTLPDLHKLRIIKYPDPILKRPCRRAELGDDSVAALGARMLELMREAPGVGLAAPQVGLSIQLFVCNPTAEEGHELIVVNPQLTDFRGAEENEEGCLSLPEVTVSMRRATSVVLDAFDPAGHPIHRTGNDLEARIWQHEFDHLYGRLIIDAMSTTDEIANRRAIKQLEEEYAPRRR